MDNLGEAQDVNKGLWPSDEPVGNHYSVREKLPRMLDMLDEHGIKATYFAESWSLEVYGDAVEEMTRRGHEVAWHGYQHEPWAALSAQEEEVNFRKSFEAAARAGVSYKGFRPPGGSINERTYGLLRQNGVEYVSPLGNLGIEKGIVILPFEWRGVDAFYYMEKFGAIREAHGEQTGVLSPNAFRDFLLSKIQEAIATGGYVSVLFHPFLQTSEEKFSVMGEILHRIGGDPDIWCAPCDQVSRWVAEHASAFTTDRV
jgi:peptidoglycan/xylan/chitin deacetylase (PgdA/CDA1 family)